MVIVGPCEFSQWQIYLITLVHMFIYIVKTFLDLLTTSSKAGQKSHNIHFLLISMYIVSHLQSLSTINLKY